MRDLTPEPMRDLTPEPLHDDRDFESIARMEPALRLVGV